MAGKVNSGYSRWIWGGAAALCLSVPGWASEKIQIEGNSLSLPEKDSGREELSPSFEAQVQKPQIGGFVPYVPPSGGGVLSRKLKEALDREENWIFMNPYELDRRTSGLEMLEGDSETASGTFEDPRQEQQTVLERFLKEKDRRMEEKRNELRRDPDRGPSRFEPVLGDSSRFARGEADFRDADDIQFARELSLESYLNPREMFGRPAPGDRYEKDHFRFSTVADRPELSAEQQADLRAAEERRSAAFQRLLQPRSLTPSIAGVMDPINTQADTTREAARPILPFGSRPGSGSGAFSGSVFGGSERAGAAEPERGLRAGSSLDRPSVFDSIGSRVPEAPASLPSISSPSISGPTPTFGNATPFMLEIPKRKF